MSVIAPDQVTKYVAVGFNVVASILGIVAAWYWFQASRVQVQDPHPQDGVSRNVQTDDFVLPTMKAFSDSARLNKTAASLTGLAVLSSTIGNLIGYGA